MKEKGITVVAIQIYKVDENTLNEWVKKNNIPFPIGMIEGDAETTRFNWGVRSLPWLILTDRKQIVTAEGFSLSELDKKVKEVTAAERSTEQKSPRRITLRLKVENQISIWFSQDAWVGVKWNTTRFDGSVKKSLR